MKKIIFIPILVIALLTFISGCAQQPTTLVGDEILEVKVTMDNGAPLGNIEVDLWKADSTGIPNAGFNFTNNEGIVIFNIPAGDYEIGFNLNNFPDNLVYPEKTPITVEEGIPASKTILITAKQE